MRCLIRYFSLLVLLAMAFNAKADSFVQFDLGFADLTAGFSNWNDQTLRLNLGVTSKDRLGAEISNQRHFDDQGTFYGASYTRVFNDSWHGSVHAGSSDGGFFLPRSRWDAFINRKWLSNKNLVTSFGAGYYEAKDGHIDRNMLLSAMYYFPGPWIVEIGGRINRSDPGDVLSRRGFATLTYSQYKLMQVVLRHEDGNEAYQLIGETTALSDFPSSETSLTWRQLLAKNYGINAVLIRYENPSYERKAVQVGMFYEF